MNIQWGQDPGVVGHDLVVQIEGGACGPAKIDHPCTGLLRIFAIIHHENGGSNEFVRGKPVTFRSRIVHVLRGDTRAGFGVQQ